MGPARLHVVFLLAAVVAMAALRPAWQLPHAHGEMSLHAHGIRLLQARAHAHVHEHAHEHAHGPVKHTHEHRHHAPMPGDGGDDHHHHGDVDHSGDMPKARWMAPRRIDVDAPPTLLATAAACAPRASARVLPWPAEPPPRVGGAPRHLASLRSIILRL